MSAFTDQLRNVLNGTTPDEVAHELAECIYGSSSFCPSDHQARGLLVEALGDKYEVVPAGFSAEALRRCDPGDTDINALVNDLHIVADFFDGDHESNATVRTIETALAVVEQAFGEPT